jgi:hypothetical protein
MRRRGLTLIEMVATMGLTATLMGILLGLVVSGQTLWMDCRALSSRHQGLASAALSLEREVQASTPSSLTSLPDGLAFRSARDARGVFLTDVTGAPVWQNYVVYYLADGNLLRQTSALPQLPSGGRLVAEGVTRLELEHEAGSSLATVVLVAREETRRLTIRLWN